MLKTVRITFALIALALSIYSFITDNRGILLYMFIALGLVALTMSIEEFSKQKKATGTFYLLAETLTLFLATFDLFR